MSQLFLQRADSLPDTDIAIAYEQAVLNKDKDARMRLMSDVLSRQNYTALLRLFATIDTRHGLAQPRHDDSAIESCTVTTEETDKQRTPPELVHTHSAVPLPKRSATKSSRAPRKTPLHKEKPHAETEADTKLMKRNMFPDLLMYIHAHTNSCATDEEKLWLQALCEELQDETTDRKTLLAKLHKESDIINLIMHPTLRTHKAALWGALMSLGYARGCLSRDEVRDLAASKKDLLLLYEKESHSTSIPSDWK